jgi:hypothetical protein
MQALDSVRSKCFNLRLYCAQAESGIRMDATFGISDHESSSDIVRNYHRQYTMRHKDSVREYRREYNDRKSDAKRLSNRQYHADNKDTVRDYYRKYYLRNKDNLREMRRDYKIRNRDNVLDSQRDYYLRSKDYPEYYSPRKRALRSWKSPELVRKYFDSVAEQLSVSNYTDWYRISRNQVARLGGMLLVKIFCYCYCYLPSVLTF